jgi:hypothetical protein
MNAGFALTGIVYANLVALAALAARLGCLNLLKIFPAFAAYVFFDLTVTLAYPLFGYESHAYFEIYKYSSVLYSIGQISIGLEVFGQLGEGNPGFSKLSRKASRLGFAIALAVLVLAVMATSPRWHQENFECFTFACWELLRGSAFWTVAYLATMTRSLHQIGIVLPRNHRIIALAMCSQLFVGGTGGTFSAIFQLYTSDVQTWIGIFESTVQLAGHLMCIVMLVHHTPLRVCATDDTSYHALLDLKGILMSMKSQIERTPVRHAAVSILTRFYHSQAAKD